MAALVVRQAEFAVVAAALRTTNGVLIAGEAGAGKTTLAAAAVADVPTSVSIIATRSAQAIPFGALGPLLPSDMATVHPALVPSLIAERLRAVASGGWGRTAEVAARERAHGRTRRAVLAVDDAHLLDDHSAAALLALVTTGACRLLATVRTGSSPSDALATLWKDRLVERVDLQPLDRESTRVLLADRLDGQVASSAVELLFDRSQGNPLYLDELVRFGLDTGRLRSDAGLWRWTGATGLTLRLGELLQRRFDELSAAARDALDVLAIGDGLPYETLGAVVDEEAISELDQRGLLSSDERSGVLVVRINHPLLRDAAERRLTGARRRGLSARLRRAPAEQVDVVQRALWEEAAGTDPNVELLLGAADAVMLTDPVASSRFAERALRVDPSPRAALALSAAHSEAGHPDLARRAWAIGAARAHTDRERLSAGLEDLSLALWGERRAEQAAASFADLRATMPPEYDDDLDSCEALIALFTERPAEALRLADLVLARSPAPSAEVRALTTRLGGLALTDRPADAAATADRLLAALDVTPVVATRSGLAHALIAQARLFHGQGSELAAMVGASGRWPQVAPDRGDSLEPAAAGGGRDGERPRVGDGADAAEPRRHPRPAWPLLVGVRELLAGNPGRALTSLREALVDQRSGEGLFRSEAAAALIVALAESGDQPAAAALLETSPPDGVACLPALALWAQSAVLGATAPAARAGAVALEAAAVAVAAGAPLLALRYLSDAGRYGGQRSAADAAEALAAWPEPPRSRLASVRSAGILARPSRSADRLLAAAERHLEVGLAGPAAELADLALAAGGASGRAELLRRRAAARLDVAAGVGASALTRREREIARLAADGLSDKEIAESLVVSVRTVETHLRAAYRKLAIGSRRDLPAALAAPVGGSA